MNATQSTALVSLTCSAKSAHLLQGIVGNVQFAPAAFGTTVTMLRADARRAWETLRGFSVEAAAEVVEALDPLFA